MKISFVLPEISEKPIGGFKLVYQYANFFVQKGHSVTIYHMLAPSTHGVPDNVRSFKRQLRWHNRHMSWFDLNSAVNIKVGIYKTNQIDAGDSVIATAVTTADFVAGLSKSCGKKYYFIQNFENWGGVTSEQVNKTFSLPMKKIVISSWLADKVHQVNSDSVEVIPNFINDKIFFQERVYNKRANVVSLLNHTQITKRTDFGLAVLRQVKEQIPDLKVKLFGVYDAPSDLPEWVSYIFRPSEKELRSEVYNASRLYLMPSVLEGWGLTGMEAMACGAVPVATKFGGMLDFMHEGSDAALVERDNQLEFVRTIVGLLQQPERAASLSAEATKITEHFSLEKSGTLFLSFISAL